MTDAVVPIGMGNGQKVGKSAEKVAFGSDFWLFDKLGMGFVVIRYMKMSWLGGDAGAAPDNCGICKKIV